MADKNSRSKEPRYFETELATSEALRFSTWDEAAGQALRDVVAKLPVRRFFHDPSGTDTWESVELVGDIGAVLMRLSALIEQDRRTAATELTDVANYETIVTDSNFRPDALHVVTRLWPKNGTAGSIIYGARVQRVDEDRFALWSDF